MSGSQTQNTYQQTSPWAPQAGALTSAFSNAQNAYGQASTAKAPTDFVAQYTPDQLATFQSALNYANNNGTPSQNSATGTALSNAGTSATTGALTGLGQYDPTKLNNTQSIVDSANKYVAGQDIDSQVRNAMLNATQTARDVTLPGIEQNAATTGNTNSSRTGIAEGLVQRGLAQQSADLGATMRNSAYQTGLQLASANANANNTNQLGALTGAANAGTAAANAGVNAGSQSITDRGNLFNLATQAGSGQQAASQANLNNQQAQYQSQVSSPYDALNGLMGIIGTNNWGSNSTGTSTSTSSPSAWSVLGGLLGTAGSAATGLGGLGWKPFA